MAIVFSMEVSFLDETYNLEEVQNIFETKLKTKGRISFHIPDCTFISSKGKDPRQVGIIPKKIGVAVSFDHPGDQIIPNEEEGKYLIETMYESIRDLPAYQMAMVGWELGYLDHFFSYNEQGHKKSLATVQGLVVSKHLVEKYAEDKAEWKHFDKNHDWIPYSSIDEFDLCPFDEDEED